ncbi:MAG: hypothetical protein WCT04_26580 [Planctomycetota bacterium]
MSRFIDRIVLCGLMACGIGAAELPALVKENFDAVDISALSSGWHKEEGQNLSLIDEKGRGRVLKIVNKSGQTSGLDLKLDPRIVAGKILDIKFDAKLLATYEKISGKFYAGPKFKCTAKPADGGKTVYGNFTIKNGTTEWATLEGRFIVPGKVSSVTVGPCVELSETIALFDNIVVTIVSSDKHPEMTKEERAPAAPTPVPPPASKKVDPPPVDFKIGTGTKDAPKDEPKKDKNDAEKRNAEADKLLEEADKLTDQADKLIEQAEKLKARATDLKTLGKPQDE